MIRRTALLAALVALGGCTPSTGAATAPAQAIAPAAQEAAARLNTSPRHGEWAMIATGPSDSVRAWVVYPERRDKAPVVVVIHEIFGLSTWIRSVADQLAADGYIAIAPDLLTGKIPSGMADTISVQDAVAQIQKLDPANVRRQLAAAGAWGMQLPSALPKFAILGFCWGGSTAWQVAVANPPGLAAAVAYYGAAPAPAQAATIRVPVLGLFGGDDARVNATVPPADSAMRATGGSVSVNIFEGAGHGFLRQQDGRNGANLAASRKAWPLTIAFLRKNLGR